MDIIPAPDFAPRHDTPTSDIVLGSSAAPSALTSISGTPDLPTTAPIPQAQVYVELPTLSSGQRSRYRSILDREVPSADEEDGPVELKYEYHDGLTLWYFAASGDGISHKYEAEDFRIQYPDLVDAYENKKERGALKHFDPSATYVHPKSRIKLAIKLNARAATKPRETSRTMSVSSVGEEWDNESAEGEPEIDDEDFTDDESHGSKRRSTRTAAAYATKNIKAANMELPFSPKKTRRTRRATIDSDDSDGSTPVGRAAATRRSTRSRKAARANLAEEDDDAAYGDAGSGDDSDAYDGQPRRSGKGESKYKGKARAAVIPRSKLSNPAYGRIRTVADFDYNPCDVDDPYTKPLRAHRGICEKCHREPAHILLEKEENRAKKARPRKKKARKDDDDEDDEEEDMDETEKLESLGGWVQCLKCPLNAHWRCLASTQRDEILKAARERDRQEWLEKRGKHEAAGDETDKALLDEMKNAVPRRPDLAPYQMTDFTCSSCAKGGLCMGCLETALEPDFHSHKPLNGIAVSAQITILKPSGAPQTVETDVEMADGTQGPVASSSNDSGPLQEDVASELLFRCITCKRLAHYEHLPAPDEALGDEDDELVDKVIVAEYYQEVNRWQCADCASYSYRVDKIIAWRPFPPNALDPTPSGDLPSVAVNLPREYLVKWEGRSYRRVQWVPHGWLAVKHRQKLVKFFREGPKLDLLKEAVKEEETANEVAEGGIGDVMDTDSRDASLKPDQPVGGQDQVESMPDAERRIPPAWKTVDRVLDVMIRCRPTARGSKSKKFGKASRKKIVDSDDEAEDDDPEALEQWDRAFDLGEQPDQEFMMPLDEWKETTESDLVESDIHKVVWAFFKWDDLGYDEATWDSPPRKGEPGYPAYKNAFKRLVDSQHVTVTVRTKQDQAKYDDRKKGAFLKKLLKTEKHEQPVLGQSDQFKLMDFQIEGFNWLCSNWWDHQPSILADEMGLGKTVQISTFIGYIVKNYDAFPALIVVPNSTITNWVRELARWAPALRVVPFYGEATSRDVVKRYELTHSNPVKGTTGTKFHVLVTTYDTVSSRDFASVFKKIPRWEVLVVDEGQRLKNDSSLLFRKLNELTIVHRIIMTGTPLNNNIRELFNLMNFLDPDQWNDLERLEKEHEELTEELIKDLHGKLRPYFLRRVKAEVLQLPPKNEVIVPVSLTPLQKEIYKGILSKNLSLLMNFNQSATKTKAPAGKTNMNNILMELRKCIQHPYLISQDFEPQDLQVEEAHEKLVDASAKLRLLKALLPKLRAREHRVLLFSQFVIALDIIEDFLGGEGIKYLRLDGNTKQADRQKGMDEFNRPGSDVFVYLLSTRAGGVGINLWSADTVIIFDPDFNPHQDLQAIARSHRYGQTKPCLVFKLMAKGTAEERIMQAGKKKLALDHVIVQKMDEDGNEDVQSILTFGAKALFEEDEASQDIIYTDNDVDKLIEKTEQEGDQEEQAKESGLTFSFAKVWAADKDSLEELENTLESGDQVDSWAQTLQRIASEREKFQAKEATGRGVRRKVAVFVKPQQSLDLDEAPTEDKKANKKRKKSKSVVSDDSDFHVPISDDDSNITLGDSNHVSAAPTPPRLSSPGLPTVSIPTRRRRASPKDVPKATIDDQDICGLCGTSHTEPCYMTESSENLADYRRMLIYDATDESLEMRRAAIYIIDKTLNQRGKANLIAGQPLHLLEPRVAPVPPAPQPAPTSVSTNGLLPSAPQQLNRHAEPLSRGAPSVKKHASSVHQPVAGPSGLSSSVGASSPFKRLSSPAADDHKKKRTKREDGPGCLICGKTPHHLVKDCPIIAEGPASISRTIARLDPNPEYATIVSSLKKILRKEKKRMLVAEPAA